MTLDCFTQAPNRPKPKPFPNPGNGQGLPSKPPFPFNSPFPFPSPFFPPSTKPSPYGGTNNSSPLPLPNGNHDRPADDYPERPGIPDGLEDKGFGYNLLEVTVSLWNGVEGNEPTIYTIYEYGPVFGVGFGGERTDDEGNSVFTRYGLLMGRGTNTPVVRLGFGGAYLPHYELKELVTVINIQSVDNSPEPEPRRPYVPSPNSPPRRPSPSGAIPPILSPVPYVPYQPHQPPVLPQPQDEPLPLLPPQFAPSPRPSPRPLLPYPQINPSQKPKPRPIPLLPIPPSVPYIPVQPTSPITVQEEETTISIGFSPSFSTKPTPTFKPNDFKIPENKPNLANAPNIVPETEPCQCNLNEDEDYMIVKPQRITVPIVKEVAGQAITEYKSVTIVAIKGISEASNVIQQYEVEAAQRRAQIEAKSQRNLIQGQVAANNGLLVTIGSAIATHLPTIPKIWNGIKLLANNPWVDRAMSFMNLVFALHNAAMLSNNIVATMTTTIDTALNFVGFQWTTINEEGNEEPVSTSEAINDFLGNTVTKIIGADNFTNLTIAWKKANRIYQATANVLDATQGLSDAILSLNEVTASMTGKIGNALKRAGVVMENAYEWFDEQFDKFQTSSRTGFRLFDKLEKVQQGAEIIEEIVSSTVEVQESLNELNEARKHLDETVQEASDDNSRQWQEEKQNSEIKINLENLELSKVNSEDEED